MLKITLACRRTALTNALLDGTVKPKDIDLRPVAESKVTTMVKKMMDLEYDASEMFFTSWVLAKAHGHPTVALPIFPHRMFRQSYILCRADADIREPKDLEGKKFATDLWVQTTQVWVRGILQHEHGVATEKVKWINAKQEYIDPEKPKVVTAWNPPKNFHIEHPSVAVPADVSPVEWLIEEGHVEAGAIPHAPLVLLQNPGQFRRLFSDHKSVEESYYRRTGIFPIMHVVVIRSSILREDPWVAASLFEAFEKSKEQAYEQLLGEVSAALVWKQTYLEEQRALFGRDPWVNGLEPNRICLETLLQYCLEQGVIDKPVTADELFAPV